METKKINRKIMAVIKSDKENFLLLRTNPKFMKEDVWFVVTGSLKKGETPKEAVKREVKDETNLEIIKIIPSDILHSPKGLGVLNNLTNDALLVA